MTKTASVYVKMDPQLKEDVEAIYARYGMTLTEAVTVFLNQSRNIGGLPFELRPHSPNEVTLAAMREGDKIIETGRGRFTSADDLLRELKA
jgi:DNA-damage-inducible protein J